MRNGMMVKTRMMIKSNHAIAEASPIGKYWKAMR
jgi:hypothetical protein